MGYVTIKMNEENNITPNKEEKTMSKKDAKRISEIIVDLVARNVMCGASVEKAKEQAFNRMNRECPEVLFAWLHAEK